MKITELPDSSDSSQTDSNVTNGNGQANGQGHHTALDAATLETHDASIRATLDTVMQSSQESYEQFMSSFSQLTPG